MQRIFPLFALAALSVPATAQTVLSNNAGSIHIGGAGQVYVAGDIYNGSGATLNNLGLLTVTGAFINDAPMAAPASGTLNLNGTVAQTLSGAADYFAKDVVVNNAAGIRLNTRLKIDGVISFNSGVIAATNPAYPVVFTSAASVSTTNPPAGGSHIMGYVMKEGTGPFTYPTGDGGSYQPVTADLSANSAGLVARYYAGDAGSATFGTTGTSTIPLLYYNTKEYWELTPVGTATGSVTMYWDGYNDQRIGSTADLRVAHKTGGGWMNEGAASVTGSTGAGSVTSNPISSWSPFSLGSISSASPLPLRIVAIAGTALPNSNRITWRTAAEDGVTEFAIERAADGRAFTQIATQQAAGTGSSYSVEDPAPLQGAAYYRLRVTEGGDGSYSNIVRIVRAASGSRFSVYPNPLSDALHLNTADAGTFSVADLAGRVLLHQAVTGATSIDVSRLTPGIYIGMYQTAGHTETIRLVKR